MTRATTTLDKSKYQKIKTGFVSVLQETEAEQVEAIVSAMFGTLGTISNFLDETAATGHFLQQAMDKESRKVSRATIGRLNESFRLFAGLTEPDRDAVVEQLSLSIAVERMKLAGEPAA